jgi:uncharacterized membrane protein
MSADSLYAVSDHASGDGASVRSHKEDPCPSLCQNVGNTERLVSAAAGLGLGAIGLFRGKGGGLLLAALGGGLIYRAVTGHCDTYDLLGINTAERKPSTAVPAMKGAKVEQSVHINRPANELYRFWRNLANLPEVMRHLKRVDTLDSQRSRWVADGALGKEVAWDAEIINERENEMIAWASLPASEIDTAGSVHFNARSDGRGTDVVVSIKYNPPGGKIAAHVTNWLGAGLAEKLDEELHQFKKRMESGDFVMPAAQPNLGG